MPVPSNNIVNILDKVGFGTALAVVSFVITCLVFYRQYITNKKETSAKQAIDAYRAEENNKLLENRIKDYELIFKQFEEKEAQMQEKLVNTINDIKSKLTSIENHLVVTDEKMDRIDKSLAEQIRIREDNDAMMDEKINTLIDADIKNTRFTMIEAYQKYVIMGDKLDALTYKTLSDTYTRYHVVEKQNSFVTRLWDEIKTQDIVLIDERDKVYIMMDADVKGKIIYDTETK